MVSLEPVIDTGKCSGHGRCYTVAPQIFDCDEEGFPVVILRSVETADDRAALADAIASCPERAVSANEDA